MIWGGRGPSQDSGRGAGSPLSPQATAGTVEFLRRILPSTGLYIIARLVGKGWRHQVCDSIEEAAAYALQFNSQGVPTYHACAAYREQGVEREKDGRKYKVVRVQENVRAVKSFWLDLDVDPAKEGKYPSQEAAGNALGDFCSGANLPEPTVISSGGGLHVYWTLTQEIGPDEWKQTAESLKALTTAFNLRTDTQCTTDSARVLRPVGTTHRKDPNNPRLVRYLNSADSVAYGDFKSRLASALQASGIKPPEPCAHTTKSERTNEEFEIPFPPYSARAVADRCAQLRAMRDTRGCIPEPHWYACIQLLVNATEGDDLIHEWSSGYSGYSRVETERKIAQVREMGPTLCSTFASRNPGGCDGCPHSGKITSPAQLGRLAVKIPVIPADAEPEVEEARVHADASNPVQDHAASISSRDCAGDPSSRRLSDLNDQYAWVEKQQQIFRFRHRDFIESAKLKIELANRPPIQIAVGNNEPRPIPLADAWIRWPNRRGHLDIVYEPGETAIVSNKINLWSGWGCEPVAGDVSPWGALLDAAFGRTSAERKWAEQWMAYPIQVPGAKLFTALLLWGAEQGLGKSLIGQTLGALYGDNYQEIHSDDIDKPFNSWVKGKQFILGEEITSGDRRAAMNKLKTLITGGTISLNEKFQPEITLRNCVNFMFTSNSPDALHIDLHDRRICVVEFASPKSPNEFFDTFITWRDKRGGLSALMHHLLHLPLDGFNPTAEAPKTQAKEDMMDTTFTDLERWIFNRYIDPGTLLQSEVVYAGDLMQRYLAERYERVTETAVGRALSRLNASTSRRVCISGERRKLRAVRRKQYWQRADDATWVEEYTKPQPVSVPQQTTMRQSAAPDPRSLHSLN